MNASGLSIFWVFFRLFIFDLIAARVIKIGPCVLVLNDSDGSCPDYNYMQVFLFTRKNRLTGQFIAFTESSDNVTSSNFNPLHRNKLIIHGFNADMLQDDLVDLKAEYFREEPTNVWMVDYSRLATHTVCYPFAVHNIRHVGRCLARLATALQRHGVMGPHVVAHSLGAHVANYMANALGDLKMPRITGPALHLQRHGVMGPHVVAHSLGAHVANYMANALGDLKMPRITGLDPAGPLFTGRNPRDRLDSSDAQFVDVIHTNGLVQGNIERSGHVDFYVNGGVFQPGCMQESNSLSCDHLRAISYMTESVRSRVGFLGWPCTGFVQYLLNECPPAMPLLLMGEHCTMGSSGFYLLYTASEKPFALGNWTAKLTYSRLPVQYKLKDNVTEQLGQIERKLQRPPSLKDGNV